MVLERLLSQGVITLWQRRDLTASLKTGSLLPNQTRTSQLFWTSRFSTISWHNNHSGWSPTGRCFHCFIKGISWHQWILRMCLPAHSERLASPTVSMICSGGLLLSAFWVLLFSLSTSLSVYHHVGFRSGVVETVGYLGYLLFREKLA